MKKICFILLIFSVLPACNKPLSVEATAQQWVEAYYNSEFEKAKALSSPITQNMIDTVSSELIEEEEIMAFKILQMNCTTKGDSAICSYLYRDEIEDFEETIHLVRFKNKWLVDEPLADEALSEEEMEQIFNDYEELLKEELQNEIENE